VVAGPRHSRFKGTSEYIGGNEKFDVTSQHWGLGAGLESFFPVGARTDLGLGGGVDYYFASTLTGHDTSYSPDGSTVNGREDYSHSTADEAIHQPKLELRLMLGFSRRL
jgi:hypothetical protein